MRRLAAHQEATGARPASPVVRSLLPLAVVLALLGLFAVAVGLGQAFHLELPSFSGLFRHDETRASSPTRITIAALDLRARVQAVGRAADGSIAVPTGDPVRTAGWYELGPGPGDPGTAVIVGHVDTRSRAAVFARLAELTRGERIEVTRRDRHVATFTVDSVGRYPKTAFPVDEIFTPSSTPRLVLVTCGGAWIGGDVGYADNVIVFATLAT